MGNNGVDATVRRMSIREFRVGIRSDVAREGPIIVYADWEDCFAAIGFDMLTSLLDKVKGTQVDCPQCREMIEPKVIQARCPNCRNSINP